MNWRNIIVSIVVLFITIQPSFANWMGKGEVTGEVIESQSKNNGVVFSLKISSQKIESGPELGNRNMFSFDGQGWMEVTSGDIIEMRVNSSDNYGILVEQIKFIENKPGTVKQSYGIWWILLLSATIFAAVILFRFIRRKHKG